MTELARTPDGAFVLRPGLWELTVDSYCLTDASYAPGSGDGYLYAPLKGSRQDVVQTILRGAGRHPEIPQGQIQLLLWGILARSKISDLQPSLRTVARTLLSANQISGIDSNALDLIPPSERSRLLGKMPSPVRKGIEAEADLRDRLQRAASSYTDIERLAVVPGTPPKVTGPHVDRGQWAHTPGGYFIRYFPSSYNKTRVQVLLPERSRVRRDALNRIIAIEDDHGGRTETEYDDSIPAGDGRAASGSQGLRLQADPNRPTATVRPDPPFTSSQQGLDVREIETPRVVMACWRFRGCGADVGLVAQESGRREPIRTFAGAGRRGARG